MANMPSEYFVSKENTITKDDSILRLPDVIEMTGLSRSTIYSLEGRGDFPQKIKLSTRSMGFLSSEINGWIAEKKAARNEVTGV